MSQVRTNEVSLRYVIETALGTAGTTNWKQLEFNELPQFGATLDKTPRTPISSDRGRRKGIPTKLESSAQLATDITISALEEFMEGFMFSEWANVEFDLTHPKVKNGALNATATGYAFGAALSTFTNGTLLAGKMVFAGGGAITLVYAKGYALAANNGLKPLNADVTAASTEVTVSGLSVETAPANAKVFVAGIRTDDLTLTITGSTATLVSAGDVTNWATYGLRAGQWIHIGSGDANGNVQNAYSSNTVFGYARIASISGGTLNLNKLDANLVGGPFGPVAIDVMFHRFARNVAIDAVADDTRYLERSYQIEAAWPNLGGVGVTQYEYSVGNMADELALEIPFEDKATGTWGFIGLDTETPVTSRKTGASAATAPLRISGFGTMSNIAALTTDLISSASNVCFKDVTLTIKNNISPEGCLGDLGAHFMNNGSFEVTMEGQMLFTEKTIIEAIRNNTTITWAMVLFNDDGAFAFDMPAATASDGSRELPVGESVRVNLTVESFKDPTLGYDFGVSSFVGTPAVRPS